MTVIEQIPWAEIDATANLVSVVEKHVPALAGKFNGKTTPETPCPKCGGKTRFHMWRGRDGIIRATCRHCAPTGMKPISYIEWYFGFSRATAAKWWMEDNTVRVAPTVAPAESVPLDAAIALRWHNNMHVRARDYMHLRGMSDQFIDRFKVGYHAGYKRYSFPLFIDQKLWGIQYRLDPRIECVLKFLRCFEAPENKVNILRYISEKGSTNHNIYAASAIQRKPWPYAILIEGVPDVVAMWSQGFPAFSTFQGNNRAKPWDLAWNKYLTNINTIIIIPDNDGSDKGEFFASEKMKMIGGRAHMHWLPKEFKDIGEFIQKDVPTASKRLSEMLMLSPLPELLARPNL